MIYVTYARSYDTRVYNTRRYERTSGGTVVVLARRTSVRTEAFRALPAYT